MLQRACQIVLPGERVLSALTHSFSKLSCVRPALGSGYLQIPAGVMCGRDGQEGLQEPSQISRSFSPRNLSFRVKE